MPANQNKINPVLSNPAKILLAYMRCSGITDAKTLAVDLDIPIRTIQRLKLECASCANDAIYGASSVDQHNASCAIYGVSDAPNAPDMALSRADSINNITNTKTPGETRERATDADEIARQAYLAGQAIKGGKVAKSARAEQRTKGELDGSKGITFANGELTVDAETAAKIISKFPGIDVQAACDKAAPDVARMSYPTRDDAAAAIGKWARIEQQIASRGQSKTADVVAFKLSTATHLKPKLEVANA